MAEIGALLLALATFLSFNCPIAQSQIGGGFSGDRYLVVEGGSLAVSISLEYAPTSQVIATVRCSPVEDLDPNVFSLTFAIGVSSPIVTTISALPDADSENEEVSCFVNLTSTQKLYHFTTITVIDTYSDHTAEHQLHWPQQPPHLPQLMPRSTDSVSRHHLQLMLDLSYTNDDPVCPLDGLSGDLLLDVEYRYGINSTAGAPWARLMKVTEPGEVSIPFNVSGEVDQVQIRIIQREHGGGQCNCWIIYANLITDMSSIFLDRELLCDTSNPVIDFCGGSASVPRGYVTYPISISSGEAVPAGDSNCTLIDQKNITVQNCENVQNYIELRFIVSYINGSTDSICNPPDSEDEGIELAIRSPEETDWVPLAYYAVVNDRKIAITSKLESQNETINIRGYTVPLIQNFSHHTQQVVWICEERFLSSNIQFRWLQTARHHAPQPTKDSWYLDNITLAMINNIYNCSVKLQLFDSFDNTTGPYIETLRWGNLTRDNICVQQTSNVLLFGVGVPQGEGGISSRIALTTKIPLNFSCYETLDTSSITILPTPSQPVPTTTPGFGSCEFDVTTNTRLGNYSWNETSAGTHVNQSCQFGDGLVTRQCSSSAMWSLPDLSNCPSMLDIAYQMFINITISETNVDEVFSNLSEVVGETTDSGDQSKENYNVIVNTVSAASALFLAMDPTATSITVEGQQSVAAEVVSIINELQTWPDVVVQENSSTLIDSFEDIVTTLAQRENFTRFNTTRVHVALAMERVNHTELITVLPSQTFITSFGATPGGSEGEKVSISVNLQELEGNQAAFIGLPPGVINEISADTLGLTFTFYSDASLFPLEPTNGENTTKVVGSAVIGAIIGNETIRGLEEEDRVAVTFRLHNSTLNPVCVSWNFTAADGRGNWTSDGCETSQSESDEHIVTCNCSHLTNFACLVDICSRIDDCITATVAHLTLGIISTVGAVLSMIGLVLTIITLTVFKSLRSLDPAKYHIQLCLAMFCFLLVLVVGIDRTQVYGGCVAVSALIQYFTLVSFMWMGAEAVLMFQKLVIVFVQITTKYIIIVSIICWAVPLVPVIIPLAIDTDFMVTFSSTDPTELRFCFIGDISVFFGAFLGPVFSIIIFNAVIFITVIFVLVRHTRDRLSKTQGDSKRSTTIRLLFSVGGVMMLFGLTWTFGAFTVLEASLVFQFLFAVFNSLQGFFIFLFYCVISKDARQLWASVICYFCKKPSPVSTTGLTGTMEKVFNPKK